MWIKEICFRIPKDYHNRFDLRIYVNCSDGLVIKASTSSSSKVCFNLLNVGYTSATEDFKSNWIHYLCWSSFKPKA